MKALYCPRDNEKMVLQESQRRIKFRGQNLTISGKQYVCKKCGVEAGTIEQGAAFQKAIIKAYHKATGIMIRLKKTKGEQRMQREVV